MANFITGIISLTIGVVILANVYIVTVKGVNQSYGCDIWNGSQYNRGVCTWNGAEVAMWGLLTLLGIGGMVYGVMNIFGLS